MSIADAQAALHPDFLGETARRIGLRHYPDTRQFVVQHLYPDTLRLLLLLHDYVPIDRVIGIGYSGNPKVVDALRARGIDVLLPTNDMPLDALVDKALGETLHRCERDGLRLLIHEVGGYSVRALHQHWIEHVPSVVGAIEVTKQGVWVAESLPQLRIPQLNCAQTRLKEIEGGQVGEAVVSALDTILRQIGFSVVGREALVTGYGWVGRGVARSLSQRGMRVSVADPDLIKCVEATVDGFGLCRDPSDPGTPAIVVGASGRTSIGAELLERLPDRCFLVSGASKDHEIDLAALAALADGAAVRVHEHVQAWRLRRGRTLYLVNEGFPVNFTGASVPDEIVEFLFAELVMLVQELMERPPAPGTYPLAPELEALAARVWLDLR